MGISHIQETKEDCHEPDGSRNDELRRNKTKTNKNITIMKKVLLSIFAVAALASCFQNEELVGVGSDQPIAFDNAYVGGATKAIDNSFNNDNLDLFQVYGTVTANGATSDIFRGVEVRKANGVWAYDEEHTQYWMAGNDYSFKAVVAGNEAGATEVVLGQHYMPTAIKVLDASQQKDVLYSEVLKTSDIFLGI